MAKEAAEREIPAKTDKTGSIRSDLPIMIWDGDCAFCARWIKKWQKITSEQVQYAPYQIFEKDANGRLKKFPSLSVKDCERAVQLVMSKGLIYHGAEAVFRALDTAGKKKIWLWLYKHLPGFKLFSEMVYNFVASHRPLLSKILK